MFKDIIEKHESVMAGQKHYTTVLTAIILVSCCNFWQTEEIMKKYFFLNNYFITFSHCVMHKSFKHQTKGDKKTFYFLLLKFIKHTWIIITSLKVDNIMRP